MGEQVLISVVIMGLITTIFATILLVLSEKWKVEEDPRIDEVEAALPGANCGGCGLPGCRALAEQIVAGKAPVTACPPGGSDTAEKVAKVMGVAAGETVKEVAFVHCNADLSVRKIEAAYLGPQSCNALTQIGSNIKCKWGCLGLGDCVRSCTFDAIELVNGLPRVDYEKCTACGVCVKECPKNIIHLVPYKHDEIIAVACSSLDRGPETKKFCGVGCTGCKLCVKKGPESLFKVEDNLSKVDYKSFTPELDVTEAMEKCPTKVIVRIKDKELTSR